jgi:ribosomal protein L31
LKSRRFTRLNIPKREVQPLLDRLRIDPKQGRITITIDAASRCHKLWVEVTQDKIVDTEEKSA